MDEWDPGPVGWVIGALSAAVAVGVGEFVAAFVRPAAAPVIAVGNGLIVLTPDSWKRPAIESVGTNDKPLLIAGILVSLAILGAAIGALAIRNIWAGWPASGCWRLCGVCAVIAKGGRRRDVLPSVIWHSRVRRRDRRAGAGRDRLLPPGTRSRTARARPSDLPARRDRHRRTRRGGGFRRTGRAACALRCRGCAAASPRSCCGRRCGATGGRRRSGSQRRRGPRRTRTSTASTPRSPCRRSCRRTGNCASTAWSIARSSSPSTTCSSARSCTSG